MSLVSYKTIYGNLRRTAAEGLISLIEQTQLEVLASKYFCDEDGNYTCPYSGEIISGKEIILEHIIPVYSGGGTVLFNCIPASSKINGANEKGAKHLIEWWINSPYWKNGGPKRLEKLINYMLEAYEIVFKEHSFEEIESSYLNVVEDEFDISDNEVDDLFINDTIVEHKQLRKQAKSNNINSYYGFIMDCVDAARNNGIDVTQIERRLSNLKQLEIFDEIEKYEQCLRKVQDIMAYISEKIIGCENNSYVTYTSKIDISRLIKSINAETIEEFGQTVLSRLMYIEKILNANGLYISQYLRNLDEVRSIDFLYNNNSSDLVNIDKIFEFIETLKLDTNAKVDIFVNMLNTGDSDILVRGNKKHLKGYSSIKLGGFFGRHSDKIISRLFGDLGNNFIYDKARETVLTFFEVHTLEELEQKIEERRLCVEISLEEKINIYIEMLNEDIPNKRILVFGNKETLDGYPSIGLSNFWNHYSTQIIRKLFRELKDNQDYNNARNLVKEHIIRNSVTAKRNAFIKMLNKGNSDILKVDTNTYVEDFPKIPLTRFWSDYKDSIIELLFVKLKNNPKYEVARQTILKKYGVFDYEELIFFLNSRSAKLQASREISLDEKIDIFIEMLNKGNSGILKKENESNLDGYPNIPLYGFWGRNKSKIKLRLEKLNVDGKYETAKRLIATYEFEYEKRLNIEKKIDTFIEMLVTDELDIDDFKENSTTNLKNYIIKTGNFWKVHRDEIKNKLYGKLKDNPEYDQARQLVEKYEGVAYFEIRLLSFIEILNQPDSTEELLKESDSKIIKGNVEINMASFFQKNRDEIKKIVFNNDKYEHAKKVIEAYEVKCDVDKQIPIFIEMLNDGTVEVLQRDNNLTLKGYPDIPLGQFWKTYKKRVKGFLERNIDNPEYEPARRIIDQHEIKNDINKRILIFISMLNKGNVEILRPKNKETLEGYPNVPLANFWYDQNDKIISKLEEEEIALKYPAAIQLLFKYFDSNDLQGVRNKQVRNKNSSKKQAVKAIGTYVLQKKSA